MVYGVPVLKLAIFPTHVSSARYIDIKCKDLLRHSILGVVGLIEYLRFTMPYTGDSLQRIVLLFCMIIILQPAYRRFRGKSTRLFRNGIAVNKSC